MYSFSTQKLCRLGLPMFLYKKQPPTIREIHEPMGDEDSEVNEELINNSSGIDSKFFTSENPSYGMNHTAQMMFSHYMT